MKSLVAAWAMHGVTWQMKQKSNTASRGTTLLSNHLDFEIS
jgi:hypothetical protein